MSLPFQMLINLPCPLTPELGFLSCSFFPGLVTVPGSSLRDSICGSSPKTPGSGCCLIGLPCVSTSFCERLGGIIHRLEKKGEEGDHGAVILRRSDLLLDGALVSRWENNMVVYFCGSKMDPLLTIEFASPLAQVQKVLEVR